MPLFDYKCDDCGKVSQDVLIRNLADVKCEHCKSSNVTKLISKKPASPHFKGNGFYTTDYKV